MKLHFRINIDRQSFVQFSKFEYMQFEMPKNRPQLQRKNTFISGQNVRFNDPCPVINKIYKIWLSEKSQYNNDAAHQKVI